MKKAKLHLSVLALLAAGTIGLSACNDSAKITAYYLNSGGELVAVYDNGSETNLGEWNQSNVESLGEVSISLDGYFVINGIKTNIEATETLVGVIQTVTISDDGYYVINGVKTNIVAVAFYTVTFDTGYDQTVKPQSIKDGYKVENPQLCREGYTLKGWFYNGEEWHFNTDIVRSDMTLTARWEANQYKVKFINDKGNNPADMIVTYDEYVVLPSLPLVDGYTFVGWYNGQNLVPNNLWKIASDVTLRARWDANEYTITLDPNGGTVSETYIKVTYGKRYVLPVPSNNFGKFTGWYLGGIRLTDWNGASLGLYEYPRGITVTTNWIEEISTVEQLKAIKDVPNGHYKLMADIDLSGEEWVPIGDDFKPFTGRFDGNGFEIRGLTITAQHKYTGLFGINKGTIENVTLTDANLSIVAVGQNAYIGGLAGYNVGTIRNSTVSGSVTTNPHPSAYETCTGGIAGINFATITGTTNNAPVNGVNYVGGIVGSNAGALTSVVNNGAVTASIYGGGITAQSSVGITECVNNGVVTAASYAGGVVAMMPETAAVIISQCKNTGVVNSQSSAGGIIGYKSGMNKYLRIQQCANYGNITSPDSSDYTGGIAGCVEATYISDCYNVADLSGGSQTGGILGFGYFGTISNCYAAGTIQSRLRAGGMAGYYPSGTFSQCYTNTQLSTVASAGTINGNETNASDLPNCYYSNVDCVASLGTFLKQGTYTTVRYDSDFYMNLLFWSSSTWSFSGTTYPTLVWEA